MRKLSFLIYGAGGFAREVAWLIESCSSPQARYSVASFIDDDSSRHSRTINGISVMGLEAAYDRFPEALVVSGIGSPGIRQKVMAKANSQGFAFGTVIHPRVEMSRWVETDVGTVICAGSILTTNITLGRHVQINLDCTIGHDVIMGDYATLAPGVHVSGCVHIGERVYIGTGAVIINGTEEHPLVIEDDAVIGAGACVTRSISAGLTVVGVPAKPLQKN
jgi:sugar O-acyltransferase (sialic acid O-acetyltransferase NeuD family)